MKKCSPQVSRSLVRTKTIINVYFLGRDAMDSSIVSQTTDIVVPPSTVMAHVSNHDAHHENGDDSSHTRRRHSLSGGQYGFFHIAAEHDPISWTI